MAYRSSGDYDASELTISRYLRQNFTMPDGSAIDEPKAKELMAAHPKEVESAVRLRSFAYYPGNKIADAESLIFIPDESISDEGEDSEGEI